MRQRIFILAGCIISLMLTIHGYTNESDNFAISSDGVKISYHVEGEGSPAIVFVHGWSNNRSIWDAQVSHFAEKYKVVAVDLAGFGESGNNRDAWTIEAFGADVAGVINKLDLDQVVLVGFSMGGPVVIETANQESGRVIGVVLVDNLHNIDMKYPPQMAAHMDSIMMDLVTNPTVEKMVAGGFVKRKPEKFFEQAVSMLNSASKVGWRESLINTLRWHNEDQAESLERIRVPIIAINSDRMPTNVEAFRKVVPTFQAKIIPGVGHVVMWDAPEEFNRLLEESIREFTNQ